MKLSTRSRYGVRMMIELARHAGEKPVFLRDIAASEALSEKYLSLIVLPLRGAGLVRSVRGAKGGYLLAHEPQDISLCDIVEAVDGEISLVDCATHPEICDRVPGCPTRHVWQALSTGLRNALAAVTLHDLAGGKIPETASIQPRKRSPHGHSKRNIKA